MAQKFLAFSPTFSSDQNRSDSPSAHPDGNKKITPLLEKRYIFSETPTLGLKITRPNPSY
jgi:hypothetical protein